MVNDNLEEAVPSRRRCYGWPLSERLPLEMMLIQTPTKAGAALASFTIRQALLKCRSSFGSLLLTFDSASSIRPTNRVGWEPTLRD